MNNINISTVIRTVINLSRATVLSLALTLTAFILAGCGYEPDALSASVDEGKSLVLSRSVTGSSVTLPISGLAAYIATLPVASPASPNIVPVIDAGVVINDSNQNWAQINSIVLAGKKYVSIDLSLCTAVDNTIAGSSGTPSNKDFNVFQDNEFMAAVVLPSSLTSIGDNSFYGCDLLVSIGGVGSVTVPGTVTSIGASAFYNCSDLAGILSIPNVTSIGDSAFWGCTDITSVSIPGGVIGNNAFRECSGLASLTLNGVTSIGDSAFNGCASLTGSLTIPGTVTYLGTGAFASTGYASVTVPNSVTVINNTAFSTCPNLVTVSLRNAVTVIDDSAFYECPALTTINLPATITSIGLCAFYNCAALTSVTLPANLNTLGIGAFWLTGLSGSLTIPSNVTSIGMQAFSETAITSVALPSTVSGIVIGQQAFEACASLAGVTIGSASGTTVAIGNSAFNACPLLTAITFPDTVSSIGDSAFAAKTGGLAAVTFVGSGTKVSNDNSFPFPGAISLKAAYTATGGGAGTYALVNSDWVKQ